MSDLSVALGKSAPPHYFDHKDKDGNLIKRYPVNLLDQNAKVEYSKRLFARARNAEKAAREDYTAEEYAARLDHLNDLYMAGEYDWDSERGLKFQQTTAGHKMTCSILMGISEDEFFKLMVECHEDLQPLLSLVLRESLPGIEAKKKMDEMLAKSEATTKNGKPDPNAGGPGSVGNADSLRLVSSPS